MPVSEVNEAVRQVLESSFEPLWVGGEIGRWRRHGSGHCYFTLRDQDAQIDCVMFRSDARGLPTDPDDGMEVCVFGRLTVYPAGGKYQLVVRSLEGRGDGLWRLAFERLRAALAAEGLLDPSRKRALPEVPRRVGVVTSRSGAALRDIIAVVRRRAPWTEILVSDCRVQGREAAPEIVDALERLGREGSCDVVIVTRGGGSVEDLWAFNEESVARAIAACPIPVVSAVGHEIDVTIADLVADHRAATPSAAAETVVPEFGALSARLAGLRDGMASALWDAVRRSRDRTEDGAGRLVQAIGDSLSRRARDLSLVSARLDALSPLATLSRGYAVPLDDEGTVLRRGSMFEMGASFDLRVVDATIRCEVGGIRNIDMRVEDE
ncbi:MAG: exodeoxyribonuclease VII large subunit [Gemmatimonadetes bacterium]|nr:exodeoxyribonuclease VII large subunit [Gemmatimonadota bacterium]MCK5482237.1 exodeoxyribonuclease VII large subunit [Gemmatimonadota bacterium]MCK5490032.1 exodeoxyribonuclease VII large subunit [Gemmatimonadota bacterium]